MFSLINLEINANVDKLEENMHRAADVVDTSMSKASANADQFETAFDRASAAAGQSADMMAGKFESANDRIYEAAGKSAEAVQSIADAANDVDMRTWQEKVSAAFGAGVGTGIVAAQTWLDKATEYAETKLKYIAIGLAIAFVSATAAAVYTAYRIISASMDFLTGLFTGDSYKSANIDALIALNKEVLTLQNGLHVSAIEASALNEALKHQGVDPGAYVTTLTAAASAAHANTDELDRLGVKYKAANGELLPFTATLANAKAKLDEYTAGWDRDQAAAAMGMGSYAAVSTAVSITAEKVATSRQRLIDYNLIIGPATQAAVSDYEQAMRDFQRETDLTSQGFKAAIAGQIMPLLTDLSSFFKDGFPGVVAAFRYSMAQITSLFYGLKEVVYIVSETILESFGAIGDVVSRVAGALWKAATGDMRGAWAEMQAVPDDLGKRWGTYWENLNAQSEHNLAAMKLAWGADSIRAAMGPDSKPAAGKSWVPKPKDQSAPAATTIDPGQKFIEKLDRQIVKVGQNEYAMLRLEAAQKGVAAAAEPLIVKFQQVNEAHALAIQQQDDLAKNTDRAAASLDAQTLAVDDYQRAMARAANDAQFQIDMVGKTALETKTLTYARQQQLDVEQQISALEQQGYNVTDDTRAQLWDQARSAMDRYQSQMQALDAKEKDWQTGAKTFFDTYRDNAGNAAKQVNDLFTHAFQGMEDALVNFIKTGKLDFSSLADSIISDIMRIQIRQAMTSMLPSNSTITSSVGGFFGSLFGGGKATGGDVAAATTYLVGENGPELLTMGASGAITPNSALGGGGGVQVNVINNASGTQATAQQRTDGQGNRIIDVMIEQVKAAIAGDISRGAGPIPAALGSTYGLNRAPGMY